jgi:DNA adenine methylase
VKAALELSFDDVETPVRRAGPVPSLIKWTGSKRSLASQIRPLMPPYRRYFEPFVGGGALLFLAAVPGSIASDIYRPLIELWRLIQCSPDEVVASYRAESDALNEELNGLEIGNLPPRARLPAHFYKVRDRFNRTGSPLDLLFITRTCVNGIVRFNDKGEFNNSFHLSRRGMEPARFERTVRSWQVALRGVEFACQDYAETLGSAEPGDFVYFDPPYAGNKQRYISGLDLSRFFSELEKLNSRGVRWALSFDGRRGERDLIHDVAKSLYKRHLLLASGNSAVRKVLSGPVEAVQESLYLNY